MTASITVILSLLILLAVMLVDILTPSRLVVGILLSVPIALAAFTASRRVTLLLIVVALVADGVAAWFNARLEGPVDAITITNRVFSGLAVLLVGLLALRLRHVTDQVARSRAQEHRAREERALRELVTSVSVPLSAQELLDRAACGLRDLLNARRVVISGLKGQMLTAPFTSSGNENDNLQVGGRIETELAVRPNREPPVGYLQRENVLIGRWRRRGQPELLVIADAPREREALLGEALLALEPVLEQTVLLEDQRRDREALQRRNDVIRDLVYTFSHDIRTPLMANATSMRRALQGAYGELPEEYRRTLEHDERTNRDLLDLAEQLLLVAKLESGELSATVTELSLRELVRRRVEEMRPALEVRGVRVELALEDPARVLGNAAELRRVVQNLVDNAAKFSPPGTPVEVRLRSHGNVARLQIVDRGKGIAPDVERRLFQRFRGGAGGGSGSGLGLYLAHSIVTAHGGQLTYRRTNEPSTIFEVKLPLASGSSA